MGKVKGKDRRDEYYFLARGESLRARSALKLLQLDSEFGFLRSSNAVLDLCAAPGGWTLACLRRVPVGSLVVAVDRDPIRRIPSAVALREDITSSRCRSAVKRVMAERGCSAFDLVLHDGSPNLGGAWHMEKTVQCALSIDAVKLAMEIFGS